MKKLLRAEKRRRERSEQRRLAKDAAKVRGAVGRVWAWVVVAATLVSLLGLLAFRPQAAVNPGNPNRQGDPWTVPFQIINSGALGWHDVQVRCFVHHYDVPGFLARNGIMRSGGWTGGELDPGEAQTIICSGWMDPEPVAADMAVVVDFRSNWIPFWTYRRYFRFVASKQDGWRWLAQPSADVRDAADATLKLHQANAKLGANENTFSIEMRKQ